MATHSCDPSSRVPHSINGATRGGLSTAARYVTTECARPGGACGRARPSAGGSRPTPSGNLVSRWHLVRRPLTSSNGGAGGPAFLPISICRSPSMSGASAVAPAASQTTA
uniref:Uncharacterized protein n=1 Tax=uncultured marine virus TaxID=186617 RepID=A0A0F7LAR4_9VIRU|nr:hypothetical protein [uncultured marine virus]